MGILRGKPFLMYRNHCPAHCPYILGRFHARLGDRKAREEISLSDFQSIANRISRHVDLGYLPAGYALAVHSLVTAYRENTEFRQWAAETPGSSVEKLIACMVRRGKWGDSAWLREYLRLQHSAVAERCDLSEN